MDEINLTALLLTLKLASVTTVILLLIGTPIAWVLSNMTWRFKFLLEAVIALPLVLPPTVIGFYLLILLSPNGLVGSFVNTLGLSPLVFSFTGLVVGSVFYSLPFVVQPLQNTFSELGKNPMRVASTLGAPPLYGFFSIIIPLAKSGFLTACVLGFAHTLGEFGVVLMIGGSIPGQTQVASIAIYNHVESLQYAQAHVLSSVLLVFSFLMLALVYGVNRWFVIRTKKSA